MARVDRQRAYRLWDRLCEIRAEYQTALVRYQAGEGPMPDGYGNKSIQMIEAALLRARKPGRPKAGAK